MKHPRTGGLLDFPAIVFLQSGFNVYTVQQASRRSWCIGQKQPGEVFYLGYAETALATVCALGVRKSLNLVRHARHRLGCPQPGRRQFGSRLGQQVNNPSSHRSSRFADGQHKNPFAWSHFGVSVTLLGLQNNRRAFMEPALSKQDRISARVPHEVYETLKLAADLSGATVNQFLVQSAIKEAQSVIEREQIIRLSRRD